MDSATSQRKNVDYSALKDEKGEEQDVKLPIIGVRHWQVLLLFIMLLVVFGFRITLSVALVAMTDPKASINPDIPTYDWKDKGAILSAFFWGYIWPQPLAGYLATRFGSKWFLISSMIIQSFLVVLTPFAAANFGSLGMCANRALLGICQGFIYPSVIHQLSQWVPQEERSRLGTFTFGAGPFGTVVAMIITGIISATWYGWPLVFYIYGAIGITWCVLFTIFGSNSPTVHPTISQSEKYYLKEKIGHTEEKIPHRVPWAKIFTSIPVWALFIVQTGHNYCHWTLLTQIPSYMNHVMKFNIKNNSILSAIPYMTLWILNFVFGVISDTIINRKLVSVGTARKIFNSIGLLVPAALLIALGFTRADQTVQAVVLLVFAVSANGACMSGWHLNHMDLSPKHAGTLMGITNGMSHATAILAPLAVQFVVTDESNPQQWKVIFLLAAGVVTFVAIVFIFFGSGKVQPWNQDAEEEEEEEKH